MNHFSKPQFSITYHGDSGEQCSADYDSTLNDAISTAHRELVVQLATIKNRFPNTFEKHVVRSAKIYDNLNRSKWVWVVTISNAGKIGLKKKLGTKISA